MAKIETFTSLAKALKLGKNLGGGAEFAPETYYLAKDYYLMDLEHSGECEIVERTWKEDTQEFEFKQVAKATFQEMFDRLNMI